MTAVSHWLRAHDPDYGALRRATRTALVMPGMFAFGDKVIGNPVLATFAAFGSFAMLLLVDFQGPIRDRLLNQATLGVACAALISLATLVSRTTWLAALAMAVVAFAILFSGVVSSVLASASTALLLSFILPVSLPAASSSIPDRVAGWGLAAGASLLAISLLWPAPARNPLRDATIAACRAIATRLRAQIAYAVGSRNPDEERVRNQAVARSDEAIEQLESLFFATPYRPNGLTTDARAMIRVIDEIRWLNAIVLRSGLARHPGPASDSVIAVKETAAEVMERAAELIDQPACDRAPVRGALTRMQQALGELERETTSLLPTDEATTDAPAVVSALDPSFRAQELSFVVEQVAANAEFAAAAARRSWIDRLLGRQPEGSLGPLAAVRRRAGAHVSRRSMSLQNSLRGAAALAVAILIADVSGVQHGFWVAFGTLSVLRSNALSTGQNIVRALAGTTAGFVVGGALVYLIGTNTALLWALLPVVVLLAGLAPATISFAAGQASFTLTLLILFNLIAPAGWKIGLVRIEDVAIGGAVSLVVGLLFWPRGAATALGRALSEAYSQSARYLADAVAYGVGRCDGSAPRPDAPRRQSQEALSAGYRLDDAFRSYLAERGSKRVALAEVTGLVTGVTGVRLAGDAVLDLWRADGAADGDRAAARDELTSAAAAMTGWYDRFAASLVGREQVPEPLPADQIADGRLVAAVSRDLRDGDGHATATGVRVIWTGDHLDAARRLQGTLVDPARAAISGPGP
jgi:uncharacterized membrane protein YccC